jgi:hypothetical protein
MDNTRLAGRTGRLMTYSIQGRSAMKFFEQLGTLVGRLWKERDWDEAEFPAAASYALAELPPSEFVSIWDTVKWTFTDPLPLQFDINASFGQPPLTVYSGRDFYIDVLFWVQGLTAIHRHSFSGAFHVMHGSSLHTLWSFDPWERITTRLLCGKMSLRRAELLCRGDSRPIIAGNEFIHSTFHLDRPSISVVIRTINEQNRLPQYSYLPPSIAFDPHDLTPSVQRRTQILKMLLNCGMRTEYQELMGHLLRTVDSYQCFHYLAQAYSMIEDEGERHDLLLAARFKHSRLVDTLEPALVQLHRAEQLIRLRERISNSDLHFFLAVLLNVRGRSATLSLIQQRYPSDDPVVKVLGWLTELSKSGILDVQFNDAWLLMIRCMLLGVSPAETEMTFRDRYGDSQVSSHKDNLLELSNALRDSWLLAPMFDEQSGVEESLTSPAQGAAVEKYHNTRVLLMNSASVTGDVREATGGSSNYKF